MQESNLFCSSKALGTQCLHENTSVVFCFRSLRQSALMLKALLKLLQYVILQVNSGCQSLQLKYKLFLSPVGGAIGSCVKYTDKSNNLGVIQISPQAATDGSLSIIYLNGDICKDKKRYSTRIIFQCDQTMVIFCASCY